MSERAALESAIAALQAQRALLGDAVVDSALGPMRERLAQLAVPVPGAPPEQALRQVSVLFLDVVGSTALSQHLDPEDVHAVMDGTLERCTAVVRAHGGRVLQYAGDNLLAAFGAEQAQQDCCAAACRRRRVSPRRRATAWIVRSRLSSRRRAQHSCARRRPNRRCCTWTKGAWRRHNR